MRRRACLNQRLHRRLGWLLVSLAASCLAAPDKGLTPRDAAVVPFFQKAHQDLTHFAILLRRRVDARQDLLVAMASPRTLESRWWGNAEFVGVFVQERERPAQIFELALLPPAKSEELGQIRIQRATSTELVLARTPEKGLALESIELTFDIRRNKVNRQIRYAPFAVRGIIQRNGIPNFVATDSHESILIRPNATGEQFTIGTGSPPVIVSGKTPPFPLPQSTIKQWVHARPDEMRNGLRPEQASMNEAIGPAQVVEGRFWFGKTFYDGEGSTGIGGFGYFDPTTRKYVLFSPPEVRAWSVSAILVEEDAVWLTLAHRGEYGDSGGGVLRWDRETQKTTRYSLRPVATAIARYQDKLYFGTWDGIAVLDGNRLRRFFVDGMRRVVEEIY
jgi:hypothetical protein